MSGERVPPRTSSSWWRGVFPSSITVNPQLTIFALADYAAKTLE